MQQLDEKRVGKHQLFSRIFLIKVNSFGDISHL